MGAGPSRRVRMEREQDGGVQISENVVHSMAGTRLDDEPGDSRAGEDPILDVPQSQLEAIIEQAQHQGFQQGVEFERREKEKELKQLDVHWQEKLDGVNEQKENELVKEFDDLVSTLQHQGQSLHVKEQPCQLMQAAVKACYEQNPHTALRCRDQVAAFVACAERARVDYLASMQ
eukprot:m.89745 g.89745  ORF g.89745 m.89745 type:complete len:175 (-) comp14983_c1_seq1:33-557(-)